jgi:hypothetical protein
MLGVRKGLLEKEKNEAGRMDIARAPGARSVTLFLLSSYPGMQEGASAGE